MKYQTLPKPNTPYSAKLHFPALKAVAPGIKATQADAWGNSPSNSNWATLDVPDDQCAAFRAKCTELNLYCGDYGVGRYPWTTHSTMRLCRYVREAGFCYNVATVSPQHVSHN